MNGRLGYILYLSLVVSLGGFVFGFDASVISGAVGFVTAEFSLTPLTQGLVVGAPTLGAVISTVASGALTDCYGRKRMLIAIAALYVVSAMFSAWAWNVQVLILARFIGGLAFASLVLAPMYIGEIAPSAWRGKLIAINQLNIVLGFSAAYFANYLLLQLADQPPAWLPGLAEAPWRWMLGLELLPAVLFLLLLFRIPESPRWLYTLGRKEEAEAVLNRLMPADEVQPTLAGYQQGCCAPQGLRQRYQQLFSPKIRFVLLLGILAGITQQITGVNAIYFYAPMIFEQSGVGTDAAFAQAVWIGIVNVVFTLVAMLCIDRWGRRPLMLSGLVLVALSMALCVYGFSQATFSLTTQSLPALAEIAPAQQFTPLLGEVFHSDLEFKRALEQVLTPQQVIEHSALLLQQATTINAALILTGVLGFVAAFAISLGPVMWVLLAEIFPNRIRGVAIGFVGLINSGVSFLVQLLFPWQLDNLGTSVTFAIYGGFAVIGGMLFYRYLPETKGQSLEQLERTLERRKPEGTEPMQGRVHYGK
ncbi:MFS transporter [Ferrimonas marina]|uniref:MFS transporter, sugar porter (SP) family n=1 Tax=Ferrimonas marina TaxID=299255 RepID=A0A1M5ND30_9GAMM|nr:MFS transporter [Ferrimonas marina]SHG87484.1 MFS transporter, sugar porter (SP) family [Ferrimonas marina]